MEHKELENTLDYSPLWQPLTVADYRQHAGDSSTDQRRHVTVIAVVAVSVAAAIVWAVVAGYQLRLPGGIAPIWAALLLALVTIGAVATMVVFGRRQRTRKVRLRKFASLNHLDVLERVRDPAYYGLIFGEGTDRQIVEGLRFPGAVEIGNYQSTVGSGKNRSIRRYGYVRVALHRRLPHMVLDSRQNDLFGLVSNLPQAFDRSQTLSLEGDFDRYFTLYAPSEYEHDALYIFTPDVMRVMVDHGHKYDMEIVDDNLYIYNMKPFALTNMDSLRQVLAVVDRIAPEVRSQSSRYRDGTVPQNIAPNTVSPKGARLKRGVSRLTVVLVLITALWFIGDVATLIGRPELQVVLSSIIGVLIGIVLVASLRSKRR